MILINGIEDNVSESIGILDVGLGNIRSIYNAVYEQGYDPLLISDPRHLDDISHLILPGVGSFGFGMKSIKEKNILDAILDFTSSNRPIMGICLGMQLLFDASEESPNVKGLGLLEGDFLRFKNDSLKIPHVGWNTVDWNIRHPVIEGVKSGKDFYFVHSYFLEDSVNKLSSTIYDNSFISSVFKNNIVAFQFHPEKSQKNGLKIIDNFCSWDGVC